MQYMFLAIGISPILKIQLGVASFSLRIFGCHTFNLGGFLHLSLSESLMEVFYTRPSLRRLLEGSDGDLRIVFTETSNLSLHSGWGFSPFNFFCILLSVCKYVSLIRFKKDSFSWLASYISDYMEFLWVLDLRSICCNFSSTNMDWNNISQWKSTNLTTKSTLSSGFCFQRKNESWFGG